MFRGSFASGVINSVFQFFLEIGPFGIGTPSACTFPRMRFLIHRTHPHENRPLGSGGIGGDEDRVETFFRKEVAIWIR